MLDRSPRLAVPDESYFIPSSLDGTEARLTSTRSSTTCGGSRRCVEWGLSADAVAGRLRPGMTTGEAIGAVFAAYAAERGKQRWGDKTPLYMQYLTLLERLFPDARIVHLVRDGRDAALSFLAVPAGIMTAGWGHPRDAAGFACQWATEVRDARALGRRVGPTRYLEVRYEELVAEPGDRSSGGSARSSVSSTTRRWSTTPGRPTPPARSTSSGSTSRRASACGTGATEMSPADVAAFEAVAGDLLHELGYEVTTRGHERPRGSPPTARRRRRGAASARRCSARRSGAAPPSLPLRLVGAWRWPASAGRRRAAR